MIVKSLRTRAVIRVPISRVAGPTPAHPPRFVRGVEFRRADCPSTVMVFSTVTVTFEQESSQAEHHLATFQNDPIKTKLNICVFSVSKGYFID